MAIRVGRTEDARGLVLSDSAGKARQHGDEGSAHLRTGQGPRRRGEGGPRQRGAPSEGLEALAQGRIAEAER